jgi:hypothetical protein
MFIGHFGVAMAAKKWAPRTSLAVLLLAAELVDVAWPILLIAGVEHVRIMAGLTPVTPLDFQDYPWTHSLLMGAAWAVAFAVIYFVAKRYLAGAVACGVLVVSHWVLDYIVHIKDLPLAPWSEAKQGLALWNSRVETVTVELPIFIVGALVYSSVTRAKDKRGAWGWWSFVAFLLVMWVLSIQGNPPPSVVVLEWSALIGTIILLAWAWWVERHRETVENEG